MMDFAELPGRAEAPQESSISSMSMSAGPTNIAAGDPITVKVQISGRGSLDALTLPEQPAWHEFKTYPPTTKTETTDQLGLQGTKTFEQIVTPQNSDIKALPPISFSYFDPEVKAYHTLTQAAVPLDAFLGDVQRRVGWIFNLADVILAPTTALPPPTVHHFDNRGGLFTDRAMIRACPATWPWNLLGWPSINIPAGFTSDGLPIGVQLMGPANSEPLLISLAAELEAVSDWVTKQPEPWWKEPIEETETDQLA
jgi:hypothetical protein